MKTAQGDGPYVGVPALCRARSAIPRSMCAPTASREPKDLKGRKVGVPEYQLTANVWARAILQDDYGVKPADIHWIRGGIEDAGRIEKISIKLPTGVRSSRTRRKDARSLN